MSTYKTDMPQCNEFVESIRKYFGEPDWKQGYYFSENGRELGEKTDYQKMVEPCLNRRDK